MVGRRRVDGKKEGFWKGGDRPLLLSVSIKYTRQSGLCEKCSRHRPESPTMKMQSPRILFRSLAIMVIITSVIWAKAGNIICLLIWGFILYILCYIVIISGIALCFLTLWWSPRHRLMFKFHHVPQMLKSSPPAAQLCPMKR